MQSASKTQLTFETAQAIVAAHFRDTVLRSSTELTGGFFSAAYRLDLANGRRFVVKIAPSPAVRVLRYERDIMRAEVEALRLVRGKTSVPVPEVIAFDDTRILLPSPYFIMEFVEGVPLHTVRDALSSSVQTSIDRKLGRFVREINAIPGETFGLLGNTQFPTWRAAFDSLLRDVLSDGREIGAALPRAADALYEGAVRHFDCLDEVSVPWLVHWDLWDGNVFVDPASGEINGIIDFERALWGDPLIELNFREYSDASAFGEGYGKAVLDTSARRLRRSLYDLYLYLIMVIEDDFRQYETHEITDWARGNLVRVLEELGL